jgi:hypothetical protein
VAAVKELEIARTEYACHEGNTAIRNYIEASRFERANTR